MEVTFYFFLTVKCQGICVKMWWFFFAKCRDVLFRFSRENMGYNS